VTRGLSYNDVEKQVAGMLGAHSVGMYVQLEMVANDRLTCGPIKRHHVAPSRRPSWLGDQTKRPQRAG
jgi:hypothetical protein